MTAPVSEASTRLQRHRLRRQPSINQLLRENSRKLLLKKCYSKFCISRRHLPSLQYPEPCLISLVNTVRRTTRLVGNPMFPAFRVIFCFSAIFGFLILSCKRRVSGGEGGYESSPASCAGVDQSREPQTVGCYSIFR